MNQHLQKPQQPDRADLLLRALYNEYKLTQASIPDDQQAVFFFPAIDRKIIPTNTFTQDGILVFRGTWNNLPVSIIQIVNEINVVIEVINLDRKTQRKTPIGFQRSSLLPSDSQRE